MIHLIYQFPLFCIIKRLQCIECGKFFLFAAFITDPMSNQRESKSRFAMLLVVLKGTAKMDQDVRSVIQCASLCLGHADCEHYVYSSALNRCHVVVPDSCSLYVVGNGWRLYNMTDMYIAM